MKIKILKIEGAGNLETERIVLKVLDDDNIGRYAIFKSKKVGPTQVSVRVPLAFWFQDREIKKDDLVVLYTKVGQNQTNKNLAGNTSHFFYWDKLAPLWGGVDDAVVLLNIGEWDFKFLS